MRRNDVPDHGPPSSSKRGEERKKTTCDWTYRAVARQLRAMGYGIYEIGLRHERTGIFRRNVFETRGVFSALSWLKHANARDHHVYIRPAVAHGLILLDDLTECSLRALKGDGLEPAAVIETSAGNYQAWIKLLPIPLGLDHSLATQVAKLLASRYRGDPNSADWRHYGRLAGFTNRKPEHLDTRGFHPYALIHEWSGLLAPMAPMLLEEARHSLAIFKEMPTSTDPKAAGEAAATCSKAPAEATHSDARARSLSSSQELYRQAMDRIFTRCRGASWIANPDWSRMDYMIAQDLRRDGYTYQEIEQALLLGSPGLETRKRGHRGDYLRRTLAKALGDKPIDP